MPEEEIKNQKEEEEDYAQTLRWERQERKQEIVEEVSKETQAEIQSLIPLVRNKKKLAVILPIALMLAMTVDGGTAISTVLELILAVPSVGAAFILFELAKDLLDLSAGGVLAILFWPVGGGGIRWVIILVDAAAVVIKLLPFGITGIIPTLTISVIIIAWIIKHKADKAKKQIAELKKVDPDQISEEILLEEFDE